ncbi:MAG: hypothetical protein EON60_10440 [Alphaproteobacteria bacterium]|nr:MAG: hypothetical protein EON60_10440 [Alphaproteobacteria bacterium]
MSGQKITITVLALLLLPVLAFAASVGRLDGKPGPALRPIGTPGMSMEVERLPDTGFPKELERMGDLPAAALEWQRLAHSAHGDEREQALTNAARLYIAMDQPAVASNLITELIQQNPATDYAPEALYHISTGPGGVAQSGALKQLQEKFPGNGWSNAALMHDVWLQAQKGRVKETYNLPQAEELKIRLKKLRGEQQEKIARAGALGVFLPGAGHAYAGNIPQGITVMLVWCLFTLAFLSSCRHRHYAYSFLFVIPAASLWLSSPVVAMQLVRDETRKTIETNLQKWTDLKPVLPNAPKSSPAQAVSQPLAPLAVSATAATSPTVSSTLAPTP